MDDLISRQAAIDAADRADYTGLAVEDVKKVTDEVVKELKQLPSAQPDVPDINVGDTVSRQAALDLVTADKPQLLDADALYMAIEDLPSAKSERDVPVKPIETTDTAWGIPKKQAVCPKCDYYLGHVAFLGDYKGKRITYCETCGQAIDWEGWSFDEYE